MNATIAAGLRIAHLLGRPVKPAPKSAGRQTAHSSAPPSRRSDRPSPTAVPFAHLMNRPTPPEPLEDSSGAVDVLARARSQAALFLATVEKLKHPIAPAPPPPGSAAARFLAMVAPKTSGPVQGPCGVIRPLVPGTPEWRFMQAVKKARGEI
jgi:hypothetical protein